MGSIRAVSYTHLDVYKRQGIEGVARFLNRYWNLVMDNKDKDVKETKEMVKLRHKLVFDIEQRFSQFSLNTVVSGFMEYNNCLLYTSQL